MEAENKTALLKGTSSEPSLHFWVLAVKFWECTWKIPSNSKLPTLTTNQTLIELFCMKKELRFDWAYISLRVTNFFMSPAEVSSSI